MHELSHIFDKYLFSNCYAWGAFVCVYGIHRIRFISCLKSQLLLKYFYTWWLLPILPTVLVLQAMFIFFMIYNMHYKKEHSSKHISLCGITVCHADEYAYTLLGINMNLYANREHQRWKTELSLCTLQVTIFNFFTCIKVTDTINSQCYKNIFIGKKWSLIKFLRGHLPGSLILWLFFFNPCSLNKGGTFINKHELLAWFVHGSFHGKQNLLILNNSLSANFALISNDSLCTYF